MTHYQLTPPVEVISENLFVIDYVLFWHMDGFNCDKVLEWLKSIRWKKKHFFLSDDISADNWPNRETWAGDFEANWLTKCSVQRWLSPINPCLVDDPWNVTQLPEQSPTTFKIEHHRALMLVETMLRVNKRSFLTLN